MELERIKQFITKAVGKKGTSVESICEKLGVKDYEVLGVIELLKQSGSLVDVIDGVVYKLPKPKTIDDVYQVPSDLEHLKLLLISDTHLCSKYDRLDILRYLYEEADRRGVKHVLHSGDFTDGRSNRPEHIYELKEHSYEGQVDYCVENYPRFEGQTFVISGNHDDWWYKSAGSEIVKSIARQRDDIIYLGPDVADMQIGKLKVRLFHGKGGNSYAKSYKIQKYLDTIPTAELPDILQTGHIHQAFYYKQNKTHCFQTSCLEDQTPFGRSMGLSNDKSVWWVDVYMNSKGEPVKVEPVLEEFGPKLIRSRRG